MYILEKFIYLLLVKICAINTTYAWTYGQVFLCKCSANKTIFKTTLLMFYTVRWTGVWQYLGDRIRVTECVWQYACLNIKLYV